MQIGLPNVFGKKTKGRTTWTEDPWFYSLKSTLSAYFGVRTDRIIEQALEMKAGEAEGDQD